MASMDLNMSHRHMIRYDFVINSAVITKVRMASMDLNMSHRHMIRLTNFWFCQYAAWFADACPTTIASN